MRFITRSPKETVRSGKKIGAKLTGGDIVLLYGDLGAGKTTLVKGVAEYFGIEPNDVVSPTFTLMQIYDTNIRKSGLELAPSADGVIRKLVHIDTYRLENESQLVEIGAEDYLGEENTVCLIEWPEKVERLIEGKKTVEVVIESVGEDERMIKIDSYKQ